MNITTFIRRLAAARKAKYKTQQAFADAYKEKFGMIRTTTDENIDGNMFGTIQNWEQGKSFPTADVLDNICVLLDVDADYLLGRIDAKKHDIKDIAEITLLSESAVERLLDNRTTIVNPPLSDEDLKREKEYIESEKKKGIHITINHVSEYVDIDKRNVEFLNALILSNEFETLYKQFEAFQEYVNEKRRYSAELKSYMDILGEPDIETMPKEFRQECSNNLHDADNKKQLYALYSERCISSMKNEFESWLLNIGEK